MYTDAGVAVNGATVDLLDRNTTTPVRATTTTNSSGYWAISHATEGQFDIRITNGSSIRWRKYDDSVQLETVEANVWRLRGTDDAFDYTFSGTPTADRAVTYPDRAGQVPVGNMSWAVVASNGTLQSNSHNVSSSAKTATGVYTVTWDTDFANTNYVCQVTLWNSVGEAAANAGTATLANVLTANSAGTATDGQFQILAMGDR